MQSHNNKRPFSILTENDKLRKLKKLRNHISHCKSSYLFYTKISFLRHEAESKIPDEGV